MIAQKQQSLNSNFLLLQWDHMTANTMGDITKIDVSGMLDTVAHFPEQIEETVALVDETQLPSIFKVDNIIISGMGGSAISGDIVQTFLRDRFDITIHVNRDYDLPRWAHKNTLVFSQSYSGNTEETLSAFKHACQKKCQIIGISSGGKLQEHCEKRAVPHIKIPSGYQPRAATAYLLFSSLLSLKKIGILHNTIDTELEEVIHATKEISKTNNKSVAEKNNLAKQIASTITNTMPHIYGWGIYAPIAKRWCTQFNENSKVIARYGIVPECNHNDIVGWSHNPEISKQCTCIVFRDEKLESLYMTKRLNFMREFFDDAAANIIEVPLRGKKTFEKMIAAMYIGDFVSCYLAIARGIDPTPVDIIVELKRALAEL